MKGDFVETILGNKKSYVSHRPLNRLRSPLTCDNRDNVSTFLRQLFYYKNHLADLLYDLKRMVNEHDDKRALFEKMLRNNPFVSPDYMDWIDEDVARLQFFFYFYYLTYSYYTLYLHMANPYPHLFYFILFY